MSSIKVECISIRELFPEQIVIGKQYTVDKNSIIKHNGVTYGTAYSGNYKVGILNLNHFKELDWAIKLANWKN